MTQHKYRNMLFKLQLKHCQSLNGNNTLNERVTQNLITSPHSFIYIPPQVPSCPVHRQTDRQTRLRHITSSLVGD